MSDTKTTDPRTEGSSPSLGSAHILQNLIQACDSCIYWMRETRANLTPAERNKLAADISMCSRVIEKAKSFTRRGWAFASDADAEVWHYGGTTRHECIKSLFGYYEGGGWICQTRPVEPDDEADEEWAFVCEGKPERVGPNTKLSHSAGNASND